MYLASPRKLRKLGENKKLQAEILAHKGYNRILKEQVDSLLVLNKQLIEKFAAMGIRVKVEKQGVSYEAVKQ